MIHSVPFEVFDDFQQPVWVTNEQEGVEYLNRAASQFFRLDPVDVVGKPCHQVFQLRSSAGEVLCRSGGCPVQWHARAGRLPQTLPAVRGSPGKDSTAITLWAFALSPPDLRRSAVLHMVLFAEQSVSDSDTSIPIPKQAVGMIGRLSVREVEVLRELARGKTTEEVAQVLFVSPATVRNHIHHILDKLGVHRRMDAVLAWVRLRKKGRSNLQAP